jgi:hypothetical protein
MHYSSPTCPTQSTHIDSGSVRITANGDISRVSHFFSVTLDVILYVHPDSLSRIASDAKQGIFAPAPKQNSYREQMFAKRLLTGARAMEKFPSGC